MNGKLVVLPLFISVFIPVMACCGTWNSSSPVSAVTPQCLVRASNSFDVPLALLLAVMDVEGGRVGAVEWNRNRTCDMGPMQVNSCHMSELGDFGITRDDITNNGCLNVYTAAWIIKGHIEKTGDLVEAVGRYHSKTPYYKERYLRKIAEAYHVLKRDPSASIERILAKANNRRPE